MCIRDSTKAVNLKGTGEVIIDGNIMYNVAATATDAGESITVEGLTIQGSNPSDNAPGLCWSRQGVLDGYILNAVSYTHLMVKWLPSLLQVVLTALPLSI